MANGNRYKVAFKYGFYINKSLCPFHILSFPNSIFFFFFTQIRICCLCIGQATLSEGTISLRAEFPFTKKLEKIDFHFPSFREPPSLSCYPTRKEKSPVNNSPPHRVNKWWSTWAHTRGSWRWCSKGWRALANIELWCNKSASDKQSRRWGSPIDYTCDNKRYSLSAHNRQVPTPTSQNLELEQQIRICGPD
jgi:hypothetical protein